VPIRLLGGVAIRLRAPEQQAAALCRQYQDLDFVAPKRSTGAVQAFFRDEGYAAHVAFNALNGNERLLFFDEEHGRQVDVFVGDFRMCHAIPLGGRVDLEPRTLPLAELLLTKLQVVELNEKDVRDTVCLLHDHEVGEEDGETVNAARIAVLCANDWGLWRTFTANLRDIESHLDRYELTEGRRREVAGRIEAILARIGEEPKSRGWRLRARVGERKRWYELPEEVAGGP